MSFGFPRRVALVAVFGMLTACASASGGTSASGAPAARRDRTVITADDMKDLSASNLYEVVQRLHPEWLTARNSVGIGRASGRSSSTSSDDNDIQVYLDSQRGGNTDLLKTMSPNSALSLKYYTASEAQARFGNGNLNGVIQIVTAAKR